MVSLTVLLVSLLALRAAGSEGADATVQHRGSLVDHCKETPPNGKDDRTSLNLPTSNHTAKVPRREVEWMDGRAR